MSETGTRGRGLGWRNKFGCRQQSDGMKAVSLDEITEEVRVDRREMRSSTEPWGTRALRG